MEQTLSKIRNLYDTLGRGERKIADWLLAHPAELISLSISEVASVCGCGDATVIRFAKRLGLSGYQELKINVAREMGGNLTGNLAFSPEDTVMDVYNKHIADIKITLDETRAYLNPTAMEQSAEALRNARSISIIGLGNSAPIAQDAAHKFLRAGLPASAYSDNHMQMIVTSHLGPGDVVMAISHSGSSVDIVSALERAKANGATTICITNHGKSPVDKHSDYLLYTNAQETKYSILAMTSRIAQLAVIDTLYSYIVIRGGDTISQAIHSTEEALESKKY
ncbi:MAG: MurR/RpiR family transcriptional regulator [Oscillospiraceae bacterium]|nr:MurR/RpiR family transcriptional regulator [Oscillospiraceae bacterium]